MLLSLYAAIIREERHEVALCCVTKCNRLLQRVDLNSLHSQRLDNTCYRVHDPQVFGLDFVPALLEHLQHSLD